MAIDVTDATFETDVIERSKSTAVVVDLWAEWCGPCRTLGPILEKTTDATDGEVVLVKVNVDENPQISQAFQVQSIPAVYALKDGQVVDGFVGAYPEHVVEQFIASLRPSDEERELAGLIAAGDEVSLRAALELEPGNEEAVAGTRRAARRARASRRRRWRCWPASPRATPPATSPPLLACRRSRPTTSTTSSPACSTGSRTTTRPARSSSTCSS